jgi:Fe-S cluster assembly protein SufD
LASLIEEITKNHVQFQKSHTGSKWLNQFRSAQIEEFLRTGIPTRKDEDWKYTNLRPINDGRAVSYEPQRPLSATETPRLWPQSQGWQESIIIHFLDNVAYCSEAGISDLEISPLKPTFSKTNPVLLRTGSIFNPFLNLNHAFAHDGLCLRIKKGRKIDRPIVIHYSAGSVTQYPKVSVHCDEGSMATVIEVYGASQEKSTRFGHSDFALEKGAKLELIRLQNPEDSDISVDHTFVNLKRDSKANVLTFTKGGQLTRNNLEVDLDGLGAELHMMGVYLADKAQHIDNHTTINHKCAHGKSQQVYKGVLAGQSRVVFNGKLKIAKDASETEAHQLNKNIMLSEEAEIDTKPELAIDHDNVKCSHGATVGQIDANEMFYLKTRGISQKLAQQLLCHGFLNTVLEGFHPQATESCQKSIDLFFKDQKL